MLNVHITTNPDSDGYRWKMEDDKLWYFDPIDKRWYMYYWDVPESRVKWLVSQGKIADAAMIASLILAYRSTQRIVRCSACGKVR